jgi:ABC-2 type transport system ATP-binding protein
MSVGRMVWQGSLAELSAQQQVRVHVSTSSPASAASVLGRLGLSEVSTVDGGASAVLGDVLPEHVVEALVADGVGVRGLAVERPSLEDVFVGLTGEGFDVSG